MVPITDCADWRLRDEDHCSSACFARPHISECHTIPAPAEDFVATFKLPQKGSGRLALLHPMPREDRITFDEASHTYTVDGIKVPRSVTGFLHEYASEFDPALAIQTMKAGKYWGEKKAAFEAQGLGTEDADFLRRWAFNGEVARSRGHLLHYQAEQMCNGRQVQEPHSPEFQQARQIYARLLEKGLTPFRAEVNLFHVGLVLAGQPDLLMMDPAGDLAIVDWKRSKNIRFEGDRTLQDPLGHLPDTNYFLYSLQLNVYRYMLESEYGYRCSSMWLAVVHPDNDQPRLISCPRMDAEIAAIVDFEFECGRAKAAAVPGNDARFVV